MIPELRPDAGPDLAPAAAPGTGLWSADCHRYEVPAEAADPVVLPWPTGLDDAVVEAGTVLEWAVFPAYDHAATAWPDGFRACGTGIEVTFDDGSVAGDGTEPDGLPAAADARRGIDWPEQWNHRRLDLSPWAGRRIHAVRLVVAPGPTHGEVGAELASWVDGPRLTTPEALADTPVERVLAARGSHSSPRRSRGLTQPLVGVPHGGCYLTPATQLDEQAWTYSWSAHSVGTGPELAGLLVTRAPSPWIGDRGALGLRLGGTLDGDGRVLREPFSHDDERARPHRYTVTTLSGIAVDATAGSHAVVAEVGFPAGGYVQFAAPGGHIDHLEIGPGDITRVRVAVTTGNAPDLRYWYDVALTGADVAEVEGQGPTFRVTPRQGEPLRIEAGTSFLSLEQAGRARATLAGRALDDVAAASAEAWNEVLGLVDAPSVKDDERRAIASDLYRLFAYPTSHHEDTPDGPRYADPIHRDRPDTATATGRAVREGRFLTDNGFWDTYRTCWPAFHLLAPARAGALIDGFLEHVRISGWSARWSAGEPVDCMVGTSLDIVTADAVASGIAGFDRRVAYAAALRNATCPSPEERFGRADMPASLFRGWVRSDVEESVSWTLEGTINDAGAAVLARDLARDAQGEEAARLRAEARYLAGRAMDYDRLFDAASGFFRPRHADGALADEPFDPRVWGGAHTETNAWGSRLGVPHDGVGLAGLFGGPAGLGDALDALFAEPETARPEFSGSYGFVIHEMSEARDLRLGMCGLSNQPAHHVPWMYAFTDRPWRAAEITRDAVTRLFAGMHIGQGFPGDEDNGEMSAWHLFGLIGLLPLQVGAGEFLIGVPLLPEVTLTPLGAEPLTIRAVGSGTYVKGVTLDGERWHAPTIATSTLHQGGLLEIELSEVPVDWCEPMSARPFFAPDDGEALRWGDALAAVALNGYLQPSLADDAGARAVTVGDGSLLSLELAAPLSGLVQLTLTLADPGTHAFVVEWDDDGQWRTAATHRDERWDWPGQTRPFDLTLPTTTRALRVRWSGAATLHQVQVLAPRATLSR